MYGSALGPNITSATLVIDADENIDRSIVVVNDDTWDPSFKEYPGTTDYMVATPLVVDLTHGGMFTGQILRSGGRADRGIHRRDCPDWQPAGTGDLGAMLNVAVQHYNYPNPTAEAVGDTSQATIETDLRGESLTTFDGAETVLSRLWVGTEQALTTTLHWLTEQSFPATAPTIRFNDAKIGPAPVQIVVDGQIGSSIAISGFTVPDIAAPIVIENVGVSPGAGDTTITDPNHATVTLDGGDIVLNPTTPLTFAGGSVEWGFGSSARLVVAFQHLR